MATAVSHGVVARVVRTSPVRPVAAPTLTCRHPRGEAHPAGRPQAAVALSSRSKG
jgi:hypothetical protein